MDNLDEKGRQYFYEIKDGIEKEIDKRVTAQLDRERSLVKSSVTQVAKIAIFIVSIIGGFITILGIKTYSDVKKNTNNSIENLISSEIEDTDFLSRYDDQAKVFYDKSILESIIIRIESNVLKNNRLSIQLNTGELEDLLRIIKDKDVSRGDFENALRIITIAQLNQDQEYIINENLKELLSNPNITGHENRLISLIQLLNDLTDREFVEVITSFILANESSTELKIASINYLKQTREGIQSDLQEKLLDSKERKIQKAVILAIAFQDYRSPILGRFLDKLNLNSQEDAIELIEVVNNVIEGFYFNKTQLSIALNNQVDEEYEMIEYNVNLLGKLIDVGLYKLHVTGDLKPNEINYSMSKISSSNFRISIDERFLENPKIMTRLLVNSIEKSNDKFIRTLSFFSRVEDKPVYHDYVNYGFTVNFKSEKQLDIGKEKLFSSNKIPYRTAIISVDKNNMINLRWSDMGQPYNVNLLNVISSEGLDFSFTTDKPWYTNRNWTWN